VKRLDVGMVLAVAEHARDGLALLGDAQALVGTQGLDVDVAAHDDNLGITAAPVKDARYFAPLVLRRLVPRPIDFASVRRCSA
jgi:hypothetical protein